MKKTIFRFLLLGVVLNSWIGQLCAQSAPDCCVGLPTTFPGVNSPNQIGLDPLNGELFVANSSDKTVRVFDSATGASVKVFSSWSGGATFSGPQAICFDSAGNFYVSDYTRGVEEFTPAYAYVTVIGPLNCTGIYMDSEGVTTSLYICSQGNYIYRYDSISGGAYALGVSFGGPAVLSQPDELVKVGNMIYATDEAGFVIGFTVPGYAPTTLYSSSTSPLRGICADSSGFFYVTEMYNSALDIFSPGFASKQTTCSPPSPWGVAVNAAGNIYTSELNGTVTVFQGCGMEGTPTPTPSYQGSNPPAPGQCFVYPSPVKGDQASVAYDMAESGTMTLKIFNRIGELASQVSEHQLAGVQATSFNVSGFAPGVYFFTVTLNYDSGRSEKPQTGKFAVIR